MLPSWCAGTAPQASVYGESLLFFFQAEDGIRDLTVTGVQTCALPISLDRAAARADLAADGERLIGLLPGSRVEEVERHLPILMAACARIARQAAGARFVLALAPTIPSTKVAPVVRAAEEDGVALRVVSDATYRVMAAADLLLVASGTATLEAACYGTPMAAVYRLPPPSRG